MRTIPDTTASVWGVVPRGLRRFLAAFLTIVTFAGVVFSSAGLIVNDSTFDNEAVRSFASGVMSFAKADDDAGKLEKDAINDALGRDAEGSEKDKDDNNKNKTSPDNWLTTESDSNYAKQNGSTNRPTGATILDPFDLGFGTLIYRVLWYDYYLNPNVVSNDKNSWWKNPCSSLDGVNGAPAGDLQNDNCDVPGIGNEFISGAINTIVPQGMGSGSLKRQSRLAWNIGIADYLLPTDCVPIILTPSDSIFKSKETLNDKAPNKCRYEGNSDGGGFTYTGLEQFGYNLSWTNYNGEWDYIKVNSNVRYMSAITFGQAAGAVWAGITNVANSLGEAASNHDWGSFFKTLFWPWGEMASGVLNGIFNSFEENIFYKANGGSSSDKCKDDKQCIDRSHQTQRWYRPEFVGKTMYGAYEISDEQSKAIGVIAAKNLSKDHVDEAVAAVKGYDENADRDKAKIPPAPKKIKKDDKSSDDSSKKDNKNATEEYESWEDWMKENADQLKFGKDTLGIDAADYSKKADKSKDIYDIFKKDWESKVDDWIGQNQQQIADENQTAWTQVMEDAIRKDIEDKAGDYFTTEMSRVFCAHADGSPLGKSASDNDKNLLGSIIREGEKAHIIPELGRAAYKFDKKTGKWDWTCGDLKGGQKTPRPTIIGGLSGSSASTASQVAHTDTRRTAYTIIGNTRGGSSGSAPQFLLGISQKITMALNFLIGLSFQPLLKQTGIEDLSLTLVKAFRDTIYMNLFLIFIAVAALITLLKFFKRGTSRNFYEVAMIVIIVIVSAAALFSPEFMFKLVDDVPTAIERSLMAAVFADDGSDNICKASGSPKNTTASAMGTVKNLFGGDAAKEVDPDAQVRVMQCKIWEIYTLAPWSYGQFGVGINQLYATGYASEGGSNGGEFTVSKDTKDLIGNAAVPMGGGNTVHNWGIYQLRHTITGTTTTDDPANSAGVVDKNLYRLVDLQAGPNNGDGRDPSHFNTWKGDPVGRFMVGLTSIPAAILGIMGIGRLAIKKIEWTFTCVLMLIVTPFMLLIGIMPGRSRMRMRSWFFSILALIAKRLVAVVFMSIMIQMLVTVTQQGAGASDGTASAADIMQTTQQGNVTWSSVAMSLMVLGYLFYKYGDDLLNLFTAKIDSEAAQFMGDWNSATGNIKNMMPQTGRNILARASVTAQGIVSAGAAKVITGDWNEDSATKRIGRYKAQEQTRINTERAATIRQYQNEIERLKTTANTDGDYTNRKDKAEADEITKRYRARMAELNEDERRYKLITGEEKGELGEKNRAIREALDDKRYSLKANPCISNKNIQQGMAEDAKDIIRRNKNRLQYNLRVTGKSTVFLEINDELKRQTQEDNRVALDRARRNGDPFAAMGQINGVDYSGASPDDRTYVSDNTDEDGHIKTNAVISSADLTDEQLDSIDPMMASVAALADSNMTIEEMYRVIGQGSKEQRDRLRVALGNSSESLTTRQEAMDSGMFMQNGKFDDAAYDKYRQTYYMNKRTSLREARHIMADIAKNTGSAEANDLRMDDSMAVQNLRDDAQSSYDKALAALYANADRRDYDVDPRSDSNIYLDALDKDNSKAGRNERRDRIRIAAQTREAKIHELDELMSSDRNETGIDKKTYDLQRRDIEERFRDSVQNVSKSRKLQLNWADEALKQQNTLDSKLRDGKITQEDYDKKTKDLTDTASSIMQSSLALDELSRYSNNMALNKKLLLEHPELAKENPVLAKQLEHQRVSKTTMDAIARERIKTIENSDHESVAEAKKFSESRKIGKKLFESRGEKLGANVTKDRAKEADLQLNKNQTVQDVLNSYDKLKDTDGQAWFTEQKPRLRREEEMPRMVKTKDQTLDDMFAKKDKEQTPSNGNPFANREGDQPMFKKAGGELPNPERPDAGNPFDPNGLPSVPAAPQHPSGAGGSTYDVPSTNFGFGGPNDPSDNAKTTPSFFGSHEPAQRAAEDREVEEIRRNANAQQLSVIDAYLRSAGLDPSTQELLNKKSNPEDDGMETVHETKRTSPSRFGRMRNVATERRESPFGNEPVDETSMADPGFPMGRSIASEPASTPKTNERTAARNPFSEGFGGAVMGDDNTIAGSSRNSLRDKLRSHPSAQSPSNDDHDSQGDGRGSDGLPDFNFGPDGIDLD